MRAPTVAILIDKIMIKNLLASFRCAIGKISFANEFDSAKNLISFFEIY